MPGPVSVTATVKWPFTAVAVMRTSPVSVNLIALPTRLRSTWVRRCSSPRPTGRRLGNVGLERELLGLGQRLGCRAHRLDHALDGVLAEVQAELAGLDLGDVEHGVDEPQQVLAVGADARERVRAISWTMRLVEAFLHQLGVAEDGGERGPQLVAHVGDELRLVLARDLELRGSSAAISSNSRVFSMAITAWSAKVLTQTRSACR